MELISLRSILGHLDILGCFIFFVFFFFSFNQEGGGQSMDDGSGDNRHEVRREDARCTWIYVCVLVDLCSCSCHLLSFSTFLCPNPISLPVMASSQLFHRISNIGKQWHRETSVKKHTLRRTTVLSYQDGGSTDSFWVSPRQIPSVWQNAALSLHCILTISMLAFP